MTANRLLLEAKHVAQVANLRARILGNGLFPFTPEPSALNENDFVLWICSKRVGNSLYKRCHPSPISDQAYQTMWHWSSLHHNRRVVAQDDSDWGRFLIASLQ